MNLFVILAAGLAVSAGLNVVQLVQLQDVREDLGAAQQLLHNAEAAAEQCSTQVAQLQAQAKKRAAEAETARREAQRLARIHRQRADVILATPPAVPGDDCGSARLRLDSWWEQRR